MSVVKKGCISFGAFAITLILLTTAVAVPTVSSQTVMEKIKEQEIYEGKLNTATSILNDDDPFLSIDIDKLDAKRIGRLQTTIEQFLSSNNLLKSNYKNSEIYNSPEFQNFLNIDDGLENELEQLKIKVDEDWAEQYNNGIHFATRYIIENDIYPFFRDLFNSEEYAEFNEAFYDMQYSLAKSLKEARKTTSISLYSTADNGGICDTSHVETSSFYPEDLLIGICTIIFLLNWLAFGEIIGTFTNLITSGILAVLLIIPAVIILVSDLLFINITEALFEALFGAIEGVFYVFEEIVDELWDTVRYTGILPGFIIISLAFVVALGFSPLIFFGTFITVFFENLEGFELGYVLTNIPVLIWEILTEAANIAYDIWDSLFESSGDSYNNQRISLITRCLDFLQGLSKRFQLFNRLVDYKGC